MILAFTKLRVVNECTGREWSGYATKDLTERIDIHVLRDGGGYQRVILSGPDYRVEAI